MERRLQTLSDRTAVSVISRQRLYANRSAPDTQRDGTLRYTEGSAPRPVAFTEPNGLKSTRDSARRWMKEGAQVNS